MPTDEPKDENPLSRGPCRVTALAIEYYLRSVLPQHWKGAAVYQCFRKYGPDGSPRLIQTIATRARSRLDTGPHEILRLLAERLFFLTDEDGLWLDLIELELVPEGGAFIYIEGARRENRRLFAN